MLGQVVRCPHCLMPFRSPASVPAAPAELSDSKCASVEEPPIVAEVTEPTADVAVPVVRIRRTPPIVPKKKKASTNAGLRTGLAIGTAIFLAVGAVGAGLFLMAVTRERGPTFHRGFMPPPPPVPVEKHGPGDPVAGIGDFVARSRPRTKPLADVPVPHGREHRASLAGPRGTFPAGFHVTAVRIDDANDTVGLRWASDGSGFLTLSRTGHLRRIDYPNLEERRLLDIGQECSGLTPSGEGVLVALRGLEELWVVDRESLDVRRRIGIAGLREVVSGPDLAIAFAFVRNEADGGVPLRIDLTTGVVSGVALFNTDQGGDDPAHEFRSPALTADGRFLFALTGDEAPARYRVEDDRLTFETGGRRPAKSGSETIVSPDGRWVAAAGQVFSADDLTRPTLDLPRAVTAVGFDASGRRLFASTPNQLLTVFDLSGGRGEELAWPERTGSVRQLLVHPGGDSVLLRTNNGVLRVELPVR